MSSHDTGRHWLVAGSRLDLTVTVTGRCNFRCTYCYEDFSHGRMTPEVVNGIKQLLRRRATGLEELVLRFFGGEPLLELDLALDIAAHARRLSLSHGFELRGAVTTNGWLLTPRTAHRLCDVG